MLSRREFLKLSAIAAAGITFEPYTANPALAASNADDHFLLQIFVVGGLDNTMLFDARPRSMTQAKLLHGYVKEEPSKWEGLNGQWTWATSAADPLMPYKNDISVCNGLIMAPTFDGHPQNINYFLTGNPFGGECFLPHVNQTGSMLPMDSVMSAGLPGDLTNSGGMVPLDYDNLSILLGKLGSEAPIRETDPLWAFIGSRYEANAESDSSGMFSRGSKLLSRALPASAKLEELMRTVQLPEWKDKETKFLPVLGELFKKRIARTAVLQPNLPIQFVDCHDAGSARNHPGYIAQVVDYVVKTLQYLKATPFDDKRSLFDVTTVIVGSEFSRTMRQKERPVEETGTDHNNFTNSVIVAGKGIKGGLVLGASDFKSPDETLSKAHLKIDPDKLKIIGRPFDFSTFTPRADLPEVYKYQDHLHLHSVVNTIYELFGVPKDKYRAPEKGADPSPVLKPLLRA